ncbi:MAG: hypothetical protein J2P30_06630 [Actinobacteria bacterium]|nr:hypothetical protein [Actinomycetota bacterium]
MTEPGCACCESADCAAGRHCEGFAANGNCCACGRKTLRYWLTRPWYALEGATYRVGLR